jgi:phosphatidyl-myo-inositol alpha-mannosyltransferase
MRVAVVSPYDLGRPGGVQNQVMELVKHIRSAGHEAWVVGPGAPTGEGIDIGRTVVIPANGSRVPICLSPSAVGRTRDAVAEADVVHLHEPLMPVVGPALLSHDIPMVATAHAAAPRWVRSLYRMTPRRWWTGRVITAVSKEAAAALPMSPTIIPNGLAVSAYRLAVEKHPYRVAFLGRSEPRKGLPVLLAAWPQIHEAFPSSELVVLGATGVDGNGITFKGRVYDEVKLRELAASSFYVAPNLGGESFLITLIEGMAAGCAAVATDLPAFRDVAGEAAVYFQRGNPEALATAVIELMAQPAEKQRLSSAAEARVGRYDWSIVMPRYLEAYQAAIGGHQGHG